ncbi:unnamed protein product [Protopolystoma xenopodis]|uniref:Uncharacterized protein n=1 Tax=Protopolystoma xenopodis TaxID=117903 RepID=A0A3S5CLS7_9PLAT|nr:unnamed protein product [Protopolystoma xenopodis]
MPIISSLLSQRPTFSVPSHNGLVCDGYSWVTMLRLLDT